MQYYLISVSGEHKGKVWPVSGVPISVGRSPECTIVLSAQNVSRRHCQVVLRGEDVLLEDLGSRNLPLVNGRPVRHHHLAEGDDLFIGRDHFVLGCVADGSLVGVMSEDVLLDTVNWERVEGGRDDAAGRRIRPRTVQDLALLYEAASEFSGCADPDALLDIVRRRLFQYFNPEALWIARGQRVALYGPSLCGEAGQGNDQPPSYKTVEPKALMDACVRKECALMERLGAQDANGSEMLQYAAPVLFESMPLAVLALRTRTGRDVHPEGGLQFISLFARSLGPALYGAEQYCSTLRENDWLRVRNNEAHTIIGESGAMHALRGKTLQAAATDISVLITGETGVGKELVARALHDFSPRREAPLVIVNCAAIPRELFESELFGHVKVAFTGATAAGAGLLLKASGGTLFLDEIGDLSLENQARILRVVENRSFRAIGSTTDTHVDVRIVAATNKDLERAVRQGQFRADLFHRICGMAIHVPPLREHLEDIPALAAHFLYGLREESQRAFQEFAPGVFEVLQQRTWPGNVRELRNVVHRAITLAQSTLIQLEDIQETRVSAAPPEGQAFAGLSLEALEKQHILQTLRQYSGNVRLAAAQLGIGRTTLYTKITAYGIETGKLQEDVHQ
ncbi:MAG TPA: sigma 54-interacting transcriptional regulator [Candidatus Hydrogenedentes bacterium]|mgnify:CR=1 FL=1|nr:sigma 54-interacting transcriptional regulator [Candidatus Hydrogenedentota bacterium]